MLTIDTDIGSGCVSVTVSVIVHPKASVIIQLNVWEFVASSTHKPIAV